MNKKTQTRLIILVGGVILLLCYEFWVVGKTKNVNGNVVSESPTPSPSRGIHEVRFFDEVLFNKGVQEASMTKIPVIPNVRGGIVPHHITAGVVISRFFQVLSQKEPGVLLIIGPNHNERGSSKVLTSQYSWKTKFGVVNPDINTLNALFENNAATVDEEILTGDQSISGLIPYVSYYLPETRVVPLLVSSRSTIEESDKLAGLIHKIMGENGVVISSVDFSHDLMAKEAEERNRRTLEILYDRDLDTLYKLDSTYLDSPPSIGTTILLMEKLRATNTIVLDNTNSGKLTNDMFSETTSYLSLIFHE